MGKRVVTAATVLLLAVVSLGVAADPDPSLMGYWRFDGDYLDSSGNGWTGTPTGNATFAQGMSGFDQALTLDGSGDYVTIFGYMGILGTNPFSISLWLNSTNTGDRTMVNWGSSTNGQRVDFRLYQGRLRIEHGSGSLIGKTMMADGEWHHAALVVGPNSRIQSPDVKIYLDGVDDSAATSDPDRFNITAVTDVTIGRRGTHTDRAFLGLLDEVRIYDRALTAAEITTLAAHPKAYKPDPADGAEISASIFAFTWMPRQISLWHDVYLGTSPDLGPQDLVKPRWPAALYLPDAGSLTPGTMYYWRIDEIDPDGTLHPGDVWSAFYRSYEAGQPFPGDGAPYMDPNLTLSWKPGLNAIFHDVYFGTDAAAVAEGTGQTLKSSNQIDLSFPTGLLEPNTTYYWRVDEIDAAGQKVKGHVWSFTTLSEISVVSPNLVAWWTFDEGGYRRAVDWSGHGHHADFVGTPQWVAGYDGTALEFDGVTDQRLEAAGFNGVTGKQDRTMTVWIKTAGIGAIVAWGQNVSTQKWILRLEDAASAGVVGAPRVEVNGGNIVASRDLRDNEWHHVASVLESAGTPTTSDIKFYVDGELDPISGSTIFDVNTAAGRDVMIGYDHNSRPFPGVIDDLRIYDKALTQAEVIEVMRIDPTRAWGPSPAAGVTTDGWKAVPMTWKAGDGAVRHDVYLTNDPNVNIADVNASDTTGVYRGRQNATAYTPDPALEWGTQYFWRIDEVDGQGNISVGDVWRFVLTDFIPVDDFESYSGLLYDEIWATWLDGTEFGTKDPTNGSVVGADPAMADYGAAAGRADRQSLPIWFTNSAAVPKSEAIRTFQPAWNWARDGVTTLSLFVREGATNTGGSLYVRINSTKIPLVDGSTYPPGFINPDFVQYNVDLTGLNVSNVTSLAVGIEGIGATGVIYVDDIRLYREVPPLTTLVLVGQAIEAESGAITAPWEARSDRVDASGGQYIIVPNGSGNSNNAPAAPDNGWAVYTIDIPADGNYVIAIRGFNENPADSANDDSIWVNIPGMTVNDPNLDVSGWPRSGNMFRNTGGAIIWDWVNDNVVNTTDPLVFTLTAGRHELQISRREDGAGLDVIALFSIK